MKYRKKPVVIEAIQFNNLNADEIEDFVGKELKREIETESAYLAGKGTPKMSLTIETLEGPMKAMPNDWIIKGVKGEFYPCKPDVFELTYEKVFEGIVFERPDDGEEGTQLDPSQGIPPAIEVYKPSKNGLLNDLWKMLDDLDSLSDKHKPSKQNKESFELYYQSALRIVDQFKGRMKRETGEMTGGVYEAIDSLDDQLSNTPRPEGYWNGESIDYEVHNVIMLDDQQFPLFWGRPFVGQKRQVVAIAKKDRKDCFYASCFFIDNEDGSGLAKITVGEGSWTYPHRDVPFVELTNRSEQVPQSDWNEFNPSKAVELQKAIDDFYLSNPDTKDRYERVIGSAKSLGLAIVDQMKRDESNTPADHEFKGKLCNGQEE